MIMTETRLTMTTGRAEGQIEDGRRRRNGRRGGRQDARRDGRTEDDFGDDRTDMTGRTENTYIFIHIYTYIYIYDIYIYIYIYIAPHTALGPIF